MAGFGMNFGTMDYGLPLRNVQQFGVQHAPVVSQTPVGMPTIPDHLTPAPAATQPPAATPAPAPVPAAPPAITPAQALNSFSHSAGMDFAMQQGANALNNLYAAHGQIQSGAAAKALQSFGQNTALQNYFFPYVNMLGQQQAVGAGAASSVAGVGQNFGNTVANINGGIANAIGQGAYNTGNALANQAAIRGYANGSIGSAIGSGLGSLASSFMQPQSASPTTLNIDLPLGY